MADILAVVDDLFFLAKIQQTAKLTGIQVEPAALQNVMERLRQAPAAAIVIDLNHRSDNNDDFTVRNQTDLAQAARGAGCDILLARSAFSQRLPELLHQLAGKAPPTADG